MIERSISFSHLSGKTMEVENNQFQAERLPVHIYYTPLPKDGLALGEQETKQTFLFVTAIDGQQARAKRSFDYGTSSYLTGWCPLTSLALS